jgi:Bacterial sugar transferase
VRPGLTGLAQVRGRNALTWALRIDLDLEYVRTQSLGLDRRILASTVQGRASMAIPPTIRSRFPNRTGSSWIFGCLATRTTDSKASVATGPHDLGRRGHLRESFARAHLPARSRVETSAFRRRAFREVQAELPMLFSSPSHDPLPNLSRYPSVECRKTLRARDNQ